MGQHNFADLRQAMVASQLRTTAVNDPRVVEAMGKVARERFVPAERASLAYLDIAQPLGGGRFIPAPMVVGRLLTEARVRSTDRALVIGAGSGYAAAVLGLLVREVVALEEDPALAAIGVAALPANVTAVSGSLAGGWAAQAPYDLILFDGAVEEIPATILTQLAEGGRVATAVIDNGVTRLAIGRGTAGAFGLVPFADAEAPVLPGFTKPAAFHF